MTGTSMSIKMRIALIASITFTFLGCVSQGKQEKQLEILAANRASLIQSELPVKVSNMISIMRASAYGETIEIMMICHSSSEDLEQILMQGVQSYCSDKVTITNLDIGLVYRIKVRNSRGKLLSDRVIDKGLCQKIH